MKGLANELYKLGYNTVSIISKVAMLAMIAGVTCGVAVKVFKFFYDVVL